MIVWPGIGARSNAPKAVRTTEERLRSVAKAGRSVKIVSPFRSRPTVMLNGRLEVATSIGLSRKPQGKANEPLNWTRWRTSNPARPYSGRRLLESAGNVVAPSVSLFAFPNVYEPLNEMFGLTGAVRLVTS